MPYQANRVLSVLHHAFRQSERWGWRPQGTNPAAHVDRYPEARRGAKKEVMLTAGQMRSLLAAIDAEEEDGLDPIACAAIRFAFWTGWRISEVLGLRWSNIDLGTGRAKLLRTKTADEEYRHLPNEAIAVLEKLKPDASSPFVFTGRDSRSQLTTVKRPWRRIRERAGLADLDGLGAFRLHDLRHNVVSWDVSRGVPLEIAGRNVGHRSRQATEIYAHFAPDALKRAVDERAAATREATE
jgi:integrase